MSRKLLIAFDFDHTIVQENSDIVVRDLANSIPREVSELYTSNGWTLYMQEIFKILHDQKIKKKEILDVIHKITPVTGMDCLLKWLNDKECETIIISDSNSIFIEEWLKEKKLHKYVAEVFTNPAYFNQEELLNIQMYHKQDWCNLSNENLCKGEILDNYVKKREKEDILFQKIAYVGDGKNDFCPSLRLNKNDLLFPRKDFALHNILNKNGNLDIKAEVHPWNCGQDIINVIEKTI